MSMRLKTKEILEAGLSIIPTKDQWCQGERTNEKGQHCALGAIYCGSYEVPGIQYFLESMTAAELILAQALIEVAKPTEAIFDPFNGWANNGVGSHVICDLKVSTAPMIIAAINNTHDYEVVRKGFERAIELASLET